MHTHTRTHMHMYVHTMLYEFRVFPGSVDAHLWISWGSIDSRLETLCKSC